MNVFHNEEYDKLTTKQQKAVDAYIENGFNLKDAAEKSKYSKHGLRAWLKTEKAIRCLRAYTRFLLGQKKENLEYQIIDTYITRAFYNPADIITADGYLKVDDLKELGPLAVCIEAIETELKGVRVVKDEKGNVHEVKLFKKKVTLANREKALEQLSRYMQLMTDRIELTGKDGAPLEVYNMSRSDRRKRIKELIKKQQITNKIKNKSKGD